MPVACFRAIETGLSCLARGAGVGKTTKKMGTNNFIDRSWTANKLCCKREGEGRLGYETQVKIYSSTLGRLLTSVSSHLPYKTPFKTSQQALLLLLSWWEEARGRITRFYIVEGTGGRISSVDRWANKQSFHSKVYRWANKPPVGE